MAELWQWWKFGAGCVMAAVLAFGVCWAVATVSAKLIEAVRNRREERRIAPLMDGHRQLMRVIDYLDRTHGYKPADARDLCLSVAYGIIREMS